MEKKLESLYDYFNAFELTAFFVCESWLKKDRNYDRIKEDIQLNKGLCIHSYNRPGKRQGGGVCIITNPDKVKVEENKFARKGFEIVSVKGKIIENNRSLVLYCVYLPPNLTAKRAEEASILIDEDIARIKLKLVNPIIFVAGDVNQFGIYDCVQSHDEVEVVPPLETRGSERLDQIATNQIDSITENYTVSPLESDSCKSDHLGAFNSYEIKNFHQFEKRTYSTRKFTKKGISCFKEKFKSIDWSHIESLQGSNEKNEWFHSLLVQMIDEFFPIKTYTVKSTDNPWVTDWLKLKIRKRNNEYRKNGKSELFLKLKKEVATDLKELKKGFFDSECENYPRMDHTKYHFMI